MIEALSVQFPVKECCVALSVSRSGYYQWLGAEQSARAEANAELLKEPLSVIGAQQSMSAAGNCYENATMDAFFSTLKTECFPENQLFSSRAQARREIFEYIELCYNNQRLHSALGYQTPCQYETKFERVIDIEANQAQDLDAPTEDRALLRTQLERRCSLANGRRGRLPATHRPKGRPCRSKPKAKNPRGFGGQSHPIPSIIQ
jgi:Integrase core domain